MDKIVLKGIQVKTLIGWHDWEREALRPLILDLVIGIPNNSQACYSDHLMDTIDYETIVNYLRSELLEQKFLLIEALAEHVANTILANFAAHSVQVKVIKPNVLEDVEYVGVEIERYR